MFAHGVQAFAQSVTVKTQSPASSMSHMSDMDALPQEFICEGASVPAESRVQIIEPRDVPLGGIRAMNVRRTIPHRERRTVGAWCFLDHFGPNDVRATGGMHVPPHPHTGLQTVSWLFQGEVEHRDSLGSHQLVAPGEMNLMTAGHGISHSEVSTDRDTTLHGVQLWVVLPEKFRDTQPSFSHTVAKTVEVDAGAGLTATLIVFMGELAEVKADAEGLSEIVGAEIVLPAGGELELPARSDFEYGVLLDTGAAALNATDIPLHALAVVDTGSGVLRLTAGAAGARLVLIGGVPLHERFVMWWNFIGTSHAEVVAARESWMSDVVERNASDYGLSPEVDADTDPAAKLKDARFFDVRGFEGPPLPAPVMPASNLKPR